MRSASQKSPAKYISLSRSREFGPFELRAIGVHWQRQRIALVPSISRFVQCHRSIRLARILNNDHELMDGYISRVSLPQFPAKLISPTLSPFNFTLYLFSLVFLELSIEARVNEGVPMHKSFCQLFGKWLTAGRLYVCNATTILGDEDFAVTIRQRMRESWLGWYY